MEIVIFWGVFSAAVGILADSRGRSGFGYFLLSLLVSPLLGLIVVLVLSNKKAEQERDRLRQNEAERQIESIKAIARSNAQSAVVPPTPATLSVAEELEKLAGLRDRGILTETEFQEQKAALLRSAAR